MALMLALSSLLAGLPAARPCTGAASAGANEFEAMFEESLRTVKPGGVVKGRVVGITATHVLIDVGYKSEGQIPTQEFTDRQGLATAQHANQIHVVIAFEMLSINFSSGP